MARSVMSFESYSLSNRKRPSNSNSTMDSEESFHCSFPSSDEDEDTLLPLDDLMRLTSKPMASTPQQPSLNLSQISPYETPVKKFKLISHTPYVNSLDKLVKEKMENERLCEIETKLNEDLVRGMGIPSEYTGSSDDEELTNEHRDFVNRFVLPTNAIPDENPGEEIFHLDISGKIFSHSTLDLRNRNSCSEVHEENLIFSCDPENQLLLATSGYLGHLYRFKNCPVVLMRWMFQMSSVHPSYVVSVKILNTLMEITCDSLSFPNAHRGLWTPSLLDVATVLVNMGIDFQTLFSLPQLQPDFSSSDLASVVPASSISDQGGIGCSIFTQIPVNHLTHVLKFLGFCTAVKPESYDDQERLLLMVMLLKVYLDKGLRHSSVVDLHELVKNLLQNIKDWDSKMQELCLAISQLSNHHHDYLKLVQLLSASDVRGRQVRRQLSLICVAKLLREECVSSLTNYDLQVDFLCNCLAQMKPSSITKKMQNNPENASKTFVEVDLEAYYLIFSLLTLISEASTSEKHPPTERTHLLKLCMSLEKHVKCDIRENPSLFYRTKVKDLVARIYGKWQEILQCTRPRQGKLHDYWESVFGCGSPGTSHK